MTIDLDFARAELRALHGALGSNLDGLPYAHRARMADQLAAWTREMVPCAIPASETADRLREDGVVALGQVMSEARVAALVDWLRSRPVYAGHVAHHTDRRPMDLDAARAGHFACYSEEDIAAAPGFLELGLHSEALDLASAYLQCAPTLFSVNIWWSFAGHAQPSTVTHGWHRDFDDYRFCGVFLYLTDVGEGNAPQFYAVGNHRTDRQPGPGTEVRCMTGPAGSAFVADTYGMHRGSLPTTGDRLCAWLRYGVSWSRLPAQTGQWDPVPCERYEQLVGSDMRKRWAARMLIRAPGETDA